MSCRIIHPEFQIDLNNTDLSINEENSWFSDIFFVKYSFPLSVSINDDIAGFLGYLDHHNVNVENLIIEVDFECDGKVEKAVIEISGVVEDRITMEIRFGFEEFPSFDKKLASLDLEYLDLDTTTIQQHAEIIITQAWPNVNYNFPQIITDKYRDDDERFANFENVLNNYANGAFLENEFDTTQDAAVNRNIMQPMPYLMHILEQGFKAGGYDLAGDIIRDVDFKKATVNILSEFYTRVNDTTVDLDINVGDYINGPLSDLSERGIYLLEHTITSPGRYNFTGNCFVRAYVLRGGEVKIFVNDELKFVFRKINYTYREFFEFFDFSFFADAGTVIRIESEQLAFSRVDNESVEEGVIVDGSLTQIAVRNQDGTYSTTLLKPTVVDLKQCVPDITFGELVTALKNWKNFDLKIVGSTIEMNYIQRLMDVAPIIDLSPYEVRRPARNFKRGSTYLIKFKEVNSEEYTYKGAFIDETGVTYDSTKKRPDSNEIVIAAIPLSRKQEKQVYTAHLFTDDKALLALSLYAGITEGINVTASEQPLLLTTIVPEHWERWLVFRIEGVEYVWKCIVLSGQLDDLTERSRFYAYNNLMLVKSINRTLIRRGIWSYEIQGARMRI